MASVQISDPAVANAPKTYTVADAAEIELLSVRAEMDGTGAGAAWLPEVTIISDSGHVVARAVDQNVSIAAGGTASVSWYPFLRRKKKAAFTDCVLLGSSNSVNTTVTVTLNQAVPATGLLQVIMCASTIGDRFDTASFPTGASDSKGVGGWVWNATTQAQIGGIRESNPVGANTTTIITSALRPCTAGDLVAGDTCTVTWFSQSPALLHTSTLCVYMAGSNPAVAQDFGITYGQGDGDPTQAPSLTFLSWYRDFGANFDHWHANGHMIWALGAYPAVAGESGINGTKIGEIASGSNSVAAFCGPAVNGAAIPDPGGTWPAGATQILGNYQAAHP